MRRHHRLRRAAARRRAVRRPGRRRRRCRAATPQLTGDDRGRSPAGRRARPSARSSSTASTPRSTAWSTCSPPICHDDVDLRDHTRRGAARVRRRAAGRLRPLPRLRRARRAGAGGGRRGRRDAAERARAHLPEERHATLDRRRRPGAGPRRSAPRRRAPRRDEFVVRFQQTCGPVMAKGVEDTAFYRWFRLVALNEVGGDPTRFGVSAGGVPRLRRALARDWPTAMTTLSTHDTKRSEDVRARLSVLSEFPEEWAAARHRVARAGRRRTGPRSSDARHRIPALADARRHLGPLGPDRGGPPARLPGEGDPRGQGPHHVDRARRGLRGRGARLRDGRPRRRRGPGRRRPWSSSHGPRGAGRAAGAEARAADDAGRPRRLPGHRARRPVPGRPGQPPPGRLRRPRAAAWRRWTPARAPADLDDEKLLVVSRALRLRRDHPEWFVGERRLLRRPTTNGNAVAFARGPAETPGRRRGGDPAPGVAGTSRRLGRAHPGPARGPVAQRLHRRRGPRRGRPHRRRPHRPAGGAARRAALGDARSRGRGRVGRPPKCRGRGLRQAVHHAVRSVGAGGARGRARPRRGTGADAAQRTAPPRGGGGASRPRAPARHPLRVLARRRRPAPGPALGLAAGRA